MHMTPFGGGKVGRWPGGTSINDISGACHHFRVAKIDSSSSSGVCLVPSYLENKQISDYGSDYNKTSSCFRETFKS